MRRTLLLIVAALAIFTAGMALAQTGPTYTDIEGHQAQDSIELSAEAGCFDGLWDGPEFRPNNRVKRWQLAVVLANCVLEVPPSTTTTTVPPTTTTVPIPTTTTSTTTTTPTTLPPTTTTTTTTTTQPPATTTTVPGGPVLTPGDDLNAAVAAAVDGEVLLLADGNYDAATFNVQRTGYVTLKSQNPLGAVFTSITLDDAAYLRIESLTVNGTLESGLDNTHHIQIVGNDVRQVIVEAPPVGNPGPTDWLIQYNDIHDCPAFCVGLVSDNPHDWAPVSNIIVDSNKLGPMAGGEDAIRIHNWIDVEITNNEITGVIEDGQHNDCLQAVWGGNGLVFSGNYLHHNNCQTFFLKDGYVRNVTVTENLSIFNREGSADVVGQIWPSSNVTMTRNTFWDESAFYLRSGGVWEAFPCADCPPENITVTHNVLNSLLPYDDNSTPDNRAGIYLDPTVLVEDYNVLGPNWLWVPEHMGPNSVETTSPNFIGPNDWRLVDGTAGITWQLEGRLFGIAAQP